MPWLAPTLDGSSMWANPGSALERMLRAQDWVEVAGPQGPTIPPPVPAPPALVRTINGKTANSSGALVLAAPDVGAIPVPTSGAQVGQVVTATQVDGAGKPTAFGLLTAVVLDGVPKVAKPAGNGKAGMLDWQHDDTTGYLLHLRAGATSGSATAMIGVGTDAGAASGILVSHKNGGSGYKLTNNPGAGLGFYTAGYSANPHRYDEIFVGSGGSLVALKTGAGFADGVTTAGSAVFTSAAAAFTSADVGVSITATQPTSSAIPTGTTIASVQSATSVTLSTVMPGSTTGVRFIVAGRTPAPTQKISQVVDTDGSTLIFELRKGAAIMAVPFNARDINTPALVANGLSGQTSDIMAINITGGNAVLKVDSTGRVQSQKATILNNAVDTAQVPLTVRNYSTTSSAPGIVVWQNAAADILRVIDSTGSAILSRIGKSGAYMTKVNAAPADADITSGEMALWFDSTDGAAKLMVKAKQADGTVRTGSVALA